MVRRLILNADDYGLCAEVNAAIEELIEAGRLYDVSVLANGEAWESAAQFLRRHSHISVGAHLNAVEGRPIAQADKIRLLTDTNGQFVGLRELLLRWAKHPFAVTQAIELEWRAQLERLRAAKLRLSHVDSHQHLHVFPAAWRLAVRLVREYGITALRLPRERGVLPMRRAAALALDTSLAVSKLLTVSEGLQHNDHFLGFKRAGAYGSAELLADLRRLPAGLTEITLHPSLEDGVPYPHFLGNRERLALLDASLYEQLAELGIKLTTWGAITE
jgi:predicted glycoside hydrolase/deacetylase ChbG (UPF0249 family)